MSEIFKFQGNWYYQATDLPGGNQCFPQAGCEPYPTAVHAWGQGPVDAWCYRVEMDTLKAERDFVGAARKAVEAYRHARGMDRLTKDLGIAEAE